MKRHYKHDQVLLLLAEGLSNAAIGRELRMERQTVGRIRREQGVANVQRQPLTLEEKWATFTRPLNGGHLEWTGERGTTSGTPLMRYREQNFTAARIAFRMRTGEEPTGHARADCGMPQCVAPEHVTDTVGRSHARERLRSLAGIQGRAALCVHGHDQAEDGRYEADGRAYCGKCKRVRRREDVLGLPVPRLAPGWRLQRMRPQVVDMLREGMTNAAIGATLRIDTHLVAAVRAEEGIAKSRRGMKAAPSLEEAFRVRTEPADGGHLVWAGAKAGGMRPVLVHCGRQSSAYRVAFRIHHGREPVGKVSPGCGVHGCVAPAHMDDLPARRRHQAAFNALFGPMVGAVSRNVAAA